MSHASDKIGAGPPPGDAGTTTGPSPIGVPEGYTVERTTTTNFERGGPRLGAVTTRQTPRYFEGDDWLPATLSVEERAQLQRAMLAAGVYDANDAVRLGLWDATSRKAYRSVLELANGSGLSVGDALRAWSRAAPAEEETTTRKPLRIRVSDPRDLARLADSTARKVIGRKADPAVVARLAAEYQAVQAGEQRAYYNQEDTGGVTVEARDPQEFMAERIRQEYGVEAGARDMGLAANAFLEILDEVGG